MADRLGLESIDREGQTVVLKFRPDAKLDPAVLFRVVKERADLMLIPPTTLKLDLRAPRAAPGRRRRRRRRRSQPDGRAAKKGADPVAGGSWWAARAKAGEVTSGSRGRRS